MLELFCKKPVFQGNDEINQLEVVYRFLGTPTVECWPGLVHMPWYELVRPRDEIRNRFRDLFQKCVCSVALTSTLHANLNVSVLGGYRLQALIWQSDF